MSKATLTFTLPEDDTEHRLALDGAKWWGVAWDMDSWLRGLLKYGHPYKTPDEALQAVRDQLNGFIEDRGLNLEDYQ